MVRAVLSRSIGDEEDAASGGPRGPKSSFCVNGGSATTGKHVETVAMLREVSIGI